MGGFVSDILSKGAEAIGEKVADKYGAMLDSPKIFGAGKKLNDLAGNKEWEFSLSPQAGVIKSQLEEMNRIKTETLNKYNQNLAPIKDAIKNDPSFRSKVNPHTTVSDLHRDLTATNHPLAKSTQAILDQARDKGGASLNADKTLFDMEYQNSLQARLEGINQILGSKYENVTPLLVQLEDHPDPRMNMHAQRLMDIISNELQDTRTINLGGKEVGVSGFKSQMGTQFERLNKLRATLYGEDAQALPKVDANPTYSKTTSAERAARGWLRTVEVPLVAIPHIGQYFNWGSAPVSVITKALMGESKEEALKIIDAAGILSSTEAEAIHSDIAGRLGKLAQWTKSPTVGNILYKTFHMPGFNYLRTKQLAATGSLGFHSAIYWANKLVTENSERAAQELEEMHINPSDVLKQGGKLNEDQLKRGVYHFVNNKMFINKTIDQSLWANKNVFMRSAWMYHSFMSSQGAFLRREVMKMAKSGDYVGLAKFAAVMGLIAPATQPLLKSAALLGRTGSLDQAEDEIKKDYSGLTDPDTFIQTYADMLIHTGAYGTYANYAKAMQGHMLLNTLVGPLVGVPANFIEDSVNAAVGSSVTGTHNFKPVERDILETSIPLLGRPLSHKLAPTSKEAPKTTVRTPSIRRRKSQGKWEF